MAAVKLSEREKSLAYVTIGFVVFYLFYSFLLSPKWDEIVRLKNQARDARLELKIAEGKIKVIESLQARLGLVPAKSAAARPPEIRSLDVLRSISQATSSSRLKLISIVPKPPEDDKLKFDISCTGSYQNLYDFLRILYGLRALVIVDSLDVTGGGAEDPKLIVRISLTAH